MNLLGKTVGPRPQAEFFPGGLYVTQELCCCKNHPSSKTTKQYINDLDYYRSWATSATSLGACYAGCFGYAPRSKNVFSLPKHPLQFPPVFPPSCPNQLWCCETSATSLPDTLAFWWCVTPVHVAYCLSLCNGSRIIWGKVPVVRHTYIKSAFPKEVITQIKQSIKMDFCINSFNFHSFY